MTDDELRELRRDVDHLLDRQAIIDCIASHARGHDRHDVDLITAAYHDDGYDEHGKAINRRDRIRGVDQPCPCRGFPEPSPQHHDPHRRDRR